MPENKWTATTLPSLAAKVRSEGLTYLSLRRAESLCASVGTIEEHSVPGILIEAGCALGGSAILMAAAKSTDRPLFLYDVFQQIPPPTERDGEDAHSRYECIASGRSRGIRSGKYYGYHKNLLSKARANLVRFGFEEARHHVHFVKGRVENTLQCAVPVALAHIDVDWFDPVSICLRRIAPHLSQGGMIIVDDYFAWRGCRAATDLFLADCPHDFSIDTSAGSMLLTCVRRTLTN